MISYENSLGLEFCGFASRRFPRSDKELGQGGSMQILHWPEVIKFLALDVDETLYPKCAAYNLHQRQCELEALAAFWQTDLQEAGRKLQAYTQSLASSLGRNPSAAETVRSIPGLSQDWLVEVRKAKWQPGQFLRPHPGLPEKMQALSRRYGMAFASTSPKEVVVKIFAAIGFEGLIGQARIFGGGDCLPKPAPDVYRLTAKAFSFSPEVGLSVGDRYDFDAVPALSIGMGAVVVSGMEEFEQVVDRLLEAQ